MATAKEVLVRIEGHEKECSTRYKNIEKRLDDGAKRFNRLEMMLWGVYPFILASLALTKLL
jgi:hypothetical protein|tara:strand:+ start:15 stop:197 length:183 start_codon:yes stop_codon:yes gene_type:complete